MELAETVLEAVLLAVMEKLASRFMECVGGAEMAALLLVAVATPDTPEELLALGPCTIVEVGEETSAIGKEDLLLLGVGLPKGVPALLALLVLPLITSAKVLTCDEEVKEGVLLDVREGLVVGKKETESVPLEVPESAGVPLGVLLGVAVDEKEMLSELLALAPTVTDPVGEADTELEALRVLLDV